MFTMIRNWLETHSVRSDTGLARAERRKTRRLMRDMMKTHKVEERLQELETSKGPVYKVDDDKIFKLLITEFSIEIKDMMFILHAYRALIARNMKKLDELSENLDMMTTDLANKLLKGNLPKNVKQNTIPQKQKDIAEIGQLVAGMKQDIANHIKSFFTTWSSLSSINVSVSNLLDEASVIKDAFFQAKQSRTEIKQFDKAIKDIEQKARKESPLAIKEKEEIRSAKTHLENELKKQSALLNDIISIIHKIQNEVNSIKKKLASVNDYPSKWKETHTKQLDNVLAVIEKWDRDEISNSRVWLSKAENEVASIQQSKDKDDDFLKAISRIKM